jgi:hypothetical protein
MLRIDGRPPLCTPGTSPSPLVVSPCAFPAVRAACRHDVGLRRLGQRRLLRPIGDRPTGPAVRLLGDDLPTISGAAGRPNCSCAAHLGRLRAVGGHSRARRSPAGPGSPRRLPQGGAPRRPGVPGLGVLRFPQRWLLPLLYHHPSWRKIKRNQLTTLRAGEAHVHRRYPRPTGPTCTTRSAAVAFPIVPPGTCGQSWNHSLPHTLHWSPR